VKSNFEDIIVSNLEGVLIMDESQNNFSELRKEIEEKGLELLDDEFFPPNKTKIYISPESRLLKYDILLENIVAWTFRQSYLELVRSFVTEVDLFPFSSILGPSDKS
jgi:hypothetical protein